MEKQMLNEHHEKLFSQFYYSTHKNKYIDDKTAVLVGLAASMAVNCHPCMRFYLNKAKELNITEQEIGEVLAKVMAVSAGRVNAQYNEAISSLEGK
jgi:alkylhydroperoxidase/carboxymuconolactone decarboxylase family protein YurZ